MIPTVYGNYRNPAFTDIFPDEETFLLENQNNPLHVMEQDDARTIYYLLYAKYGNSIIASSDVNRFTYQLFSIIYSYGPTWAKRKEIQKKLRELQDDEIIIGTRQIFNHSDTPSTAPSTSTLDELLTIDSQNTAGVKKSKMEALALLQALLETDITTEFIDKFKYLFRINVAPEAPLWYEMDENVFTKED